MTNEIRKVLVLVSGDSSGEMRQAYLHLAMAGKAGFHGVAATPEGSWLFDQCRASGVPVVALTEGFGSRNGGRALLRELRKQKFDVLHGFGSVGCTLAARHKAYAKGGSLGSLYEQGCASARQLDTILAGDSALVEAFAQAGLERERIVHHGIVAPNQAALGKHDRASARRHLRIKDEQIAVLVPGPVHADLGHDTVLEALDSVKDSRLRIVMPGQRDTEFAQQIHEQAQMDTAVCGLVERLADPSLMRAFDLVLAPIRRAHAVHHVVPAMNLGLPVVGHPVGALTDLVVDGENGMLSQRDTSAGVAKVLVRALADPAELSHMGQASAQQFKRNCGLKRAARRYGAALNGLVEAHATEA